MAQVVFLFTDSLITSVNLHNELLFLYQVVDVLTFVSFSEELKRHVGKSGFITHISCTCDGTWI